MAQIIEIPGYGDVEFPDNMTDAQIEAAIKANLGQSSTVDNIANSAPVNALLGFGNAIGNNIGNIWNKLPGSPKVSPLISSQGNAYDVGNIAGQIAPYLALPEAGLGFIGRGISAIPKIGAPIAGSIGRAIPQIGLAAATSQNPLETAKITGELQAALEAAPLGLRGIGQVFNFIKPAEHAKNILNSLSGGVDSLEENGKILADSIKNAYQSAENKGSELYSSIFNNGLVRKSGLAEQSRGLIPNNIVKTFDHDINDIYKDYINNPTPETAHLLQSQLGTSIRKIQNDANKGNLSIADRKILQGYKRAQSSVKDIVDQSLQSIDNQAGTNFAKQYNDANRNWLTNVIPYTETPAIAQIAKGKITNPRNITTIFKNPEDNIQKIANELGQESKNRILYDQLGGYKKNKQPEKLLDEFKKLDESGLGSYINPQLANQIEKLQSKIKSRNSAKEYASGALGFGLGAGAGNFLGVPGLLELLSAGIGSGVGVKSPGIIDPIIGLTNVLGKSYRPIGRAGIAYTQQNQ